MNWAKCRNQKISLCRADGEMPIIQQCTHFRQWTPLMHNASKSLSHLPSSPPYPSHSGLQCIFYQVSEILSTLMIWYSLSKREISTSIFLAHHSSLLWVGLTSGNILSPLFFLFLRGWHICACVFFLCVYDWCELLINNSVHGWKRLQGCKTIDPKAGGKMRASGFICFPSLLAPHFKSQTAIQWWWSQWKVHEESETPSSRFAPERPILSGTILIGWEKKPR